MFARMMLVFVVLTVASVCCLEIDGGEKKKRTGTITGEVKATMPTPNGKNVILEVLAPGEEKARPYRVQYDPKIKAPMADVLATAKTAKVGDRVQFDWIDTGEGLAMTTLQILKKAEGKK